MATMTWRGGSGTWAAAIDWSLFRSPLATDSLVLGAGAPYIVRIDAAAAAQDVAIDSGARLDITSTLTLAGTLTVANGGSLVLEGTVKGGTLDLRQGSVSGAGTLHASTVLGGLGLLAYASIDTATASATAAANAGTLAANGALTLAGGYYGGLGFVLNPAVYTTSEINVANGSAVTFGPHATIDLFQDGTQYNYAIAGIVAGLVGGGAVLNQGTILSNVSNQAGGALEIGVASFTNAGTAAFAPLLAPQSGSFVVGTQIVHGQPIPIYGLLSWQQALAATLDVGSASFINTGSFVVDGGTLDFTGGPTLINAGLILLDDSTGQTVLLGPNRVTSVQPVTLSTSLEVGADVTAFSNTGTIAADTIQFDGNVALTNLGTLRGALRFAGTLDLGGGTLDASAYTSVSITGMVSNGTLLAGTGTLALIGATLDAVALPGAGALQETGPIVLIDPPAGAALTLDGTVTELDLSAGSTSSAVIAAGAVGTTDLIRLRSPGTATMAAGFRLTAAVAGSTVEIGPAAAGGAADIVAGGSIAVDAANLLVSATLDGNGTLSLADDAAVTLQAVAASAAQTIAFGTGVSLLAVAGSGTLGLTLTGLHRGDQIDFTSISSLGGGVASAVAAGGTLSVIGASGQSATVLLGGADSGVMVQASADSAGGTLLQVACFLRGTRIATPFGAAPVESLRAGDPVRCASGRIAPVRWVGHTAIDLSRHPHPALAAPIRIAAHAFAPQLPQRDLLVSREHCVLVDGALVPAERLTNGASIARDDGFVHVEYWHVELDRHDILLAEGLPAESYLDTGNRALFAGQAGARPLYPDLSLAEDTASLAVWAARGCAPLRPDAADSRARLAARAEALGWQRSFDPAPALAVAGRAVPSVATATGLRALLPAGATRIDLLSRSIVPAETIVGSGDTRRLGLAVRAALLAGWPLHGDAFVHGWHDDIGEGWRWTDGAASLVLPRLARPTVLTLHLARAARYWAAVPTKNTLPDRMQTG